MQRVDVRASSVTLSHATARPAPSRLATVESRGGMKRRSNTGLHDVGSSSSGAGMSGAIEIVSMSADSSACWYDASRFRIAPIAWRATTRRVQNDRPLRIRSTS